MHGALIVGPHGVKAEPELCLWGDTALRLVPYDHAPFFPFASPYLY